MDSDVDSDVNSDVDIDSQGLKRANPETRTWYTWNFVCDGVMTMILVVTVP